MRLTRAVSTFIFLFVPAVLGVSAQQESAAPMPAAPGNVVAGNAVAPSVFENRGKPIRLPYACSADDIQWGGLSCTKDEPCSVFLELSAAAAAGNRILVAGNLHAESVTLYSLLLASDDEGRTWTEVYQRMRGAALDHIQFLDRTTGWISGEQLFPLPQDPFLLLTTDGGKTWSERPVFNEAAEDRFGVVQQFVFTDKDHGKLIVDRSRSGSGRAYALYETRTGGESWNIVADSTKPPHMGPSPPASPWRVRVDAATRAFHVERRQGERWISVAAFAVTLAPCE